MQGPNPGSEVPNPGSEVQGPNPGSEVQRSQMMQPTIKACTTLKDMIF